MYCRVLRRLDIFVFGTASILEVSSTTCSTTLSISLTYFGYFCVKTKVTRIKRNIILSLLLKMNSTPLNLTFTPLFLIILTLPFTLLAQISPFQTLH